MEKVFEKLRYIEDSSRRNNIRIDGIPESNENDESWAECQQKTTKVLEEKLGLENIWIDRAHIIVRSKESKHKNKLRTITFKLLSYQDKESILGGTIRLKDTGILVNENFRLAIRSDLCEKVNKLRKQGKYDCLVTNKPGYERFLLLLIFPLVLLKHGSIHRSHFWNCKF